MSRRRTAEFDEARIDAIFAELNQRRLPGAAVGIAIDGTPLYRKGFGLASMELPVTLSPTMRMRIGSTTKHFTALCYLLLCEDGPAGIDDTVGTYLPELHPVARRVTMRQLMGNIGGLREAHDICWQFCGTGRPVSADGLLSLYRDIEDVNAAPGSTWIYNNGGWLMLSRAIERITGRSLGDVFRERIFQPLGMHDTMLRAVDTDFVPNSATLHTSVPSGGYEKSYLGGELAGDGGIVSTVDDMLLWLAHLAAPTVGGAATWKAMTEPQVLTNGTSTGYGLGLVIGRYRGVGTISHGGGVLGGNSQMLTVPAAGLDVVVMLNRTDVLASSIVDEILNACLPGLDPVGDLTGRRPAYGIFQSPTTGRVIQLLARNDRQFASIDGIDVPVEPDEDGVLRPVGMSAYMKQAITPTGAPETPTSIEFDHFGTLDELVALRPSETTDLGTVAGRYRSATTGTEVTICETAEGPRLKAAGRFGSAEMGLEYLADRVWRARPSALFPPGGILSFDADAASFHFSSFRTWFLPFRRII